jgi:hypothetical protein
MATAKIKILSVARKDTGTIVGPGELMQIIINALDAKGIYHERIQIKLEAETES